MKKISLTILSMLILVQFAVPYSLIRHKERILSEGSVCRFLTRPIDPADPFKGRYVRLGFEQDYLPFPENEEPGIGYKARIYAIIEIGADGFARFTGWSDEKPSSGTYLETRYLGRKNQWNESIKRRDYLGLRIAIPFDRYYMDEAKAPRAEHLARKANRTKDCWAEVRILDGNAEIEDVYVHGKSLRVLAAQKE